MRRIHLPAILFALFITSSCQAEKPPTAASWIFGTWEKTQDEDKSPPDTIKFLPNGTFVSYGPNCEEKIFPYHVHGGNIYLDIDILGKGPVALVYRPNDAHTALTFTSPRTMNNAVYEHVSHPTCGRAN